MHKSQIIFVCITYLFRGMLDIILQFMKITFIQRCRKSLHRHLHHLPLMFYIPFTPQDVFFCPKSDLNGCEAAPAVLTCSLAPLSVDAGPVSVLLLEETQGSQRGRLPRVRAPRRVGGHPGERAQLRRGRWRRAGPGETLETDAPTQLQAVNRQLHDFYILCRTCTSTWVSKVVLVSWTENCLNCCSGSVLHLVSSLTKNTA